jgi:hypothetical protein
MGLAAVANVMGQRRRCQGARQIGDTAYLAEWKNVPKGYRLIKSRSTVRSGKALLRLVE